MVHFLSQRKRGGALKKGDRFGHTGAGEERAEPAADCEETGGQPEHGEEVHREPRLSGAGAV